MKKSINKISTNIIPANEVMFNSLGITVPSCNKCCEACNGCKMKFFSKLQETV